jgi:hypothetical protein
MIEQNFIENELVILSKPTIDLFLKQKNVIDCIALYTFYYYTAKWQKTNQIKCATKYAAQGLKKSDEWVRKTKNTLIELNLVDDIKTRDETGKIIGWYIKLNYIWKNETVKATVHPTERR